MFHLIWYVLVGLIAGVIAKNVMHVHMTIFWTIVLGIIGSILGGGLTHMFSRPSNERRPDCFHTGRNPGSLRLLQAQNPFSPGQPLLILTLIAKGTIPRLRSGQASVVPLRHTVDERRFIGGALV
jgi:hypothetical protein